MRACTKSPYKKMRKGQKAPYKKSYQKQAVIYKNPKPKVDMKYCDYSSSNFNVTSSGTFFPLFSSMVRGDNGLNNFQGNNIYPKYIQMDYYFGTAQAFNSCRVMLFQWEDSLAPNLATLLANSATGLATISPPNVSAKAQLKVLYDDKFIMAPTASGDSTVLGYGTHIGSCFVPEKKLKTVRFTSTTATVADNNIFVLFISDDTVPVYPVAYFHSRVGFTD